MDITYNKTQDNKLSVSIVQDPIVESFSMDELVESLKVLTNDRDAFIAKNQIEVDGWNQAITAIQVKIGQANSLGVK